MIIHGNGETRGPNIVRLESRGNSACCWCAIRLLSHHLEPRQLRRQVPTDAAAGQREAKPSPLRSRPPHRSPRIPRPRAAARSSPELQAHPFRHHMAPTQTSAPRTSLQSDVAAGDLTPGMEAYENDGTSIADKPAAKMKAARNAVQVASSHAIHHSQVSLST
jgi:hypothetical protein